MAHVEITFICKRFWFDGSTMTTTKQNGCWNCIRRTNCDDCTIVR